MFRPGTYIMSKVSTDGLLEGLAGFVPSWYSHLKEKNAGVGVLCVSLQLHISPEAWSRDLIKGMLCNPLIVHSSFAGCTAPSLQGYSRPLVNNFFKAINL